MRISDWSSDVCSSDLAGNVLRRLGIRPPDGQAGLARIGVLAQLVEDIVELKVDARAIGASKHDAIVTELADVPVPRCNLAAAMEAAGVTSSLHGTLNAQAKSAARSA